MKGTKLLLLLLFGARFSVAGQEEFVDPPSRLLTTVRFEQLTGGVVLLQGKLDDYTDTLNFILDSGSSGISLDSATVARLKLIPQASDRTIRGIAGIKKVGFLYNRSLSFPTLTVDSLNFHVNDYEVLTSVYGVKIDGIIGYGLLSRFIVKLNYDEKIMSICSPGAIKYPKGGYLFKPILSTLPVQTAKVRDHDEHTARFLHDIGAGVCLMLSKDFAEDSSVLLKDRKLWPKEGEGIGGKVSMHLTLVKELKIGPYRFRNVPTYIFDDIYNITSYPYLGGLIGNDIFRRFNVIFNYPNRDIHLLPNRSFRDEFDYSYSGMELYLIDNKILVGNVSDGSPAQKAGVKLDDEVISINTLNTKDLAMYKNALQVPNELVKLLVKRGGRVFGIEFRVKSIL